MSGTLDPPIVVVNTFQINRYEYSLLELIPHTSVRYIILCYNDDTPVKTISGYVKGEQYKEWMTDDWMDQFIKLKIEENQIHNIGV